MASRNERQCICAQCTSHGKRVYDPTTGAVFPGRIMSEAEYKSHRRSLTAAKIATSHLATLSSQTPLAATSSATVNTNSSAQNLTHVPNGNLPMDGVHPGDDGDTDKPLRRQLRNILVHLEQTPIETLMGGRSLVFRVTPSHRSPPMLTPSPKLLDLEVTVAVNFDVVRHERWLQWADELTERLQSSNVTSSSILRFTVALRPKILERSAALQTAKMRYWERLRIAISAIPSSVRRLDTGELHFHQSWMSYSRSHFSSEAHVTAVRKHACHLDGVLSHCRRHASHLRSVSHKLPRSSCRPSQNGLAVCSLPPGSRIPQVSIGHPTKCRIYSRIPGSCSEH